MTGWRGCTRRGLRWHRHGATVTTIVATREAIYADSKCSIGDLHYPTAKVYRIGKNLIGMSGNNQGIEKFLKWFCGKRKNTLELEKGDNFSIVVLSKHGIWLYHNCTLGDQVERDWCAIGVGAGVAIGALCAGADPVKAIEIACAETNYTGPPVRTYYLDPKRGGASAPEWGR